MDNGLFQKLEAPPKEDTYTFGENFGILMLEFCLKNWELLKLLKNLVIPLFCIQNSIKKWEFHFLYQK